MYNGCEGDIGNVWVILDCEEIVIESNYYEFDDRFREAILIGSNGEGEYFGIDRAGNYFVTPAIGGSEDTVYLGKTLEDFLAGNVFLASQWLMGQVGLPTAAAMGKFVAWRIIKRI